MSGSAEQRQASVRFLAAEILGKVDRQKAYADILLDQALKAGSLNQRNRALLTELVYGTLRWRGKIDWQLSPHLRQPLLKTDPLIRNLLRLTCYQLLFLDRIPDYAAVNEAVEVAKMHGGRKNAGFVNGVLRSFLRYEHRNEASVTNDEPVKSIAVEYSHPEWLVQRWCEEFGVEPAQELMRANNDNAPLVLRVNTIKCSRDELLQRFSDAGVTAIATNR